MLVKFVFGEKDQHNLFVYLSWSFFATTEDILITFIAKGEKYIYPVLFETVVSYAYAKEKYTRRIYFTFENKRF